MSTKNLTLDSVLKIAVLMEDRGAKFYSTMKDMVSDPSIKDILHRLAEDEKIHAKQFRRILENGESMASGAISQDTRLYLESLQGKDFYKDFSLTGTVEVPTNPMEAIALGIEAEKNSILFYHELYQSLPPGDVRDSVGKLLREEKMHLVELRNYLDEM